MYLLYDNLPWRHNILPGGKKLEDAEVNTVIAGCAAHHNNKQQFQQVSWLKDKRNRNSDIFYMIVSDWLTEVRTEFLTF